MTWPLSLHPPHAEPKAALTLPRPRGPQKRWAPPVAAPVTIAHVVTEVPEHVLLQEEIKRTLRDILDLPAARLPSVLALFDNALVDSRYSVLPVEGLRQRRTLSQTIGLYREHAVALGRTVAARCMEEAGVHADEIDLVITISCTGFMIPSLDAHLANDLGFRPDVRRLPITELGCVAGAAALARAHDFVVGHPGCNVLLVSVELPTLSFQREDLSIANLVSTALFGDGAAAALMVGREGPGLAVRDTEAHLFPTSTDALGYELRDTGFHVLLAKELPGLVRGEILAIVERLTGRAGLTPADLSFFLLHPGGRKILLALEEALGLSRAETGLSWDVMRTHGNLSSATVFFILRAWLEQARAAPGAYGLLGGFGPGFSTELLLLQRT